MKSDWGRAGLAYAVLFLVLAGILSTLALLTAPIDLPTKLGGVAFVAFVVGLVFVGIAGLAERGR